MFCERGYQGVIKQVAMKLRVGLLDAARAGGQRRLQALARARGDPGRLGRLGRLSGIRRIGGRGSVGRRRAGQDPLPRPFLWSAEKDGRTTYLFGTMHVGIDAEARLPRLIWDKLDAAGAFAVETDVTDPAITRMGGRAGGIDADVQQADRPAILRRPQAARQRC